MLGGSNLLICAQIADRVKQALLIYDEVVVEDGTYMAAITEHGSSAPYLPPGYLPDDERIIEFERDLKPDNLIIGIGPDGQSRLIRALERLKAAGRDSGRSPRRSEAV